MTNKTSFTVMSLFLINPLLLLLFLELIIPTIFHLPSFIWTNWYFSKISSLSALGPSILFPIYSSISFLFWRTPRDIHPCVLVLVCTLFLLCLLPSYNSKYSFWWSPVWISYFLDVIFSFWFLIYFNFCSKYILTPSWEKAIIS